MDLIPIAEYTAGSSESIGVTPNCFLIAWTVDTKKKKSALVNVSHVVQKQSNASVSHVVPHQKHSSSGSEMVAMETRFMVETFEKPEWKLD